MCHGSLTWPCWVLLPSKSMESPGNRRICQVTAAFQVSRLQLLPVLLCTPSFRGKLSGETCCSLSAQAVCFLAALIQEVEWEEQEASFCKAHLLIPLIPHPPTLMLIEEKLWILSVNYIYLDHKQALNL